MVTQEHHLALHHEIDAFARFGAIAHHVAKAVILLEPLLFDVPEDSLTRFQVAVDITNDGLHAVNLPGSGRVAVRCASDIPVVGEAVGTAGDRTDKEVYSPN